MILNKDKVYNVLGFVNELVIMLEDGCKSVLLLVEVSNEVLVFV